MNLIIDNFRKDFQLFKTATLTYLKRPFVYFVWSSIMYQSTSTNDSQKQSGFYYPKSLPSTSNLFNTVQVRVCHIFKVVMNGYCKLLCNILCIFHGFSFTGNVYESIIHLNFNLFFKILTFTFSRLSHI